MYKNARDDLKNFQTKHISVLAPKFESKKGYRYGDISNGHTLSEQLHFLKEYQKNSLLNEVDAVTALQCPDCNSDNLCVGYKCQLCSSSNISKGVAIQHDYCGNVDFDHEYVSHNGTPTCRKCGQFLKAIGLDYSSLGPYYKCGKCGALLPTVSFQYQCFGCGRASTQDELNSIRLPTYSVNHEMLNEIYDRDHYLDSTITELEKSGITAVLYGSRTGLSNMKHTFPLLVYDSREFPLLVLEIIDSSNDAELNLLSFIARCNDAKILNKVVIFKPAPDTNLRQLAEINGIVVVESKNDDLVPPVLVDIIKQAVHKAPAIA